MVMEMDMQRTITVAVDRGKASQSALVWTIDYMPNRIVKLVHVVTHTFPSSSSSPPGHNTPDDSQAQTEAKEILLPFRDYCMRRKVQYEIAVLEGQDVANALIEYISRFGIEDLVLGVPSRIGLLRLEPTDIPNSVINRAPDFCSVYSVGRGKVYRMHSATRRPAISFSAAERGPNFNNGAESHTAYDEVSGTSFLPQKVLEDLKDEIKRLRMELKQTMEMYHAAWKEAVTEKQKAIDELQDWKVKEEQRLKETQLELEAAVEEEKAKSKAAILAAEAAQRFAGEEVQKRVHAEQIFKALRESDEEKDKVLDALCQSHLVIRYQCLIHIFVVLFLFYFYFLIF